MRETLRALLHRPSSISELQLRSRRAEIERILSQNQDLIPLYYDISIVQRAEQLPDLDCFSYVFGIQKDSWVIKEIDTNWEAGDLDSADVVFYIEKGRMKHVGKVTDRQTVVSKWGRGYHVFEHPLLLIPTIYGTHTYMFRRPSSSPVVLLE